MLHTTNRINRTEPIHASLNDKRLQSSGDLKRKTLPSADLKRESDEFIELPLNCWIGSSRLWHQCKLVKSGKETLHIKSYNLDKFSHHVANFWKSLNVILLIFDMFFFSRWPKAKTNHSKRQRKSASMSPWSLAEKHRVSIDWWWPKVNKGVPAWNPESVNWFVWTFRF